MRPDQLNSAQPRLGSANPTYLFHNHATPDPPPLPCPHALPATTCPQPPARHFERESNLLC